ncbi:MAG: flagellar brake protein [Eubacterium sp.]|nr:flagellar brake protein [Eubacterium sp.]
MVANVLHLGDKTDIRMVQQAERETQTGLSAHIYKSQVHDITPDGGIEVTMPIEQGKVVLLSLGLRYEFVFYTNAGLYHATGRIKERYKKDNIYVFLIELQSQMEKFQRREYYRYPCLIDVKFYPISAQDAKMMPSDRILQMFRESGEAKNAQKDAMLLDLSGGGARFIGKEKLETDSYILMVIRLTSSSMDKQYFIKCHVLASEEAENRWGKIETRVQFIFHDNRMQEEIIRYIFEEERKVRKKS